MRKTLLPLLLCAGALTLSGCNFLSPSGGKSSKKKKSSSSDTSEVVSTSDSTDVSNTSNTVAPTSTPTGGGNTTSATPTTSPTTTSTTGGELTYTSASAIDAVCTLLSSALGQTVTAYHDATDGDYWVGNFGDNSLDSLKSLAVSCVPTGFSQDGDWATDQFEDGTPVEYLDFVWNNAIYLEYLVYTVSGQSEDDYNGNYLQIDAGNVQ